MPWFVVLMIIWCGFEILVTTLYIGKRVEITGFSAVLTTIIQTLFIIALIALGHHYIPSLRYH